MHHIIAVSHGTDNPDGRASIELVRQQMQEVLNEREPGGFTVHEAYVDVQEPALTNVAAGFEPLDRVTIVPLLLSTGYHTQVDIAEAAAASGVQNIAIARALGPSAALAKLQRQPPGRSRLGRLRRRGHGRRRFLPPRWPRGSHATVRGILNLAVPLRALRLCSKY